MYLRSPFKEKLQLLRPFTQIFEHDVELDHLAVRNVLDLMQLRNKYVHADETSFHNKVDEVYFDSDFPLFSVSKVNPLVDHAIRSFHNPSKEKIEAAREAATAFCVYLGSRLHQKYSDEIRFIMTLDQLSYNESKKIYSSVFNPNPFTFFFSEKRPEDDT